MAVTSETIQINITAATEAAVSAIEKVSSALATVKSNFDSLKGGERLSVGVDGNSVNELNGLAKSIANIKAEIKEIGRVKLGDKFNVSDKAAGNINDVTEALSQAKETLKGFNFKFEVKIPKGADERIEKMAQAVENTKDVLQGFDFKFSVNVPANAATRIYAIAGVMRQFKADLADFESKIKLKISIPEGASERLKDLAQTIHEINEEFPDVNGFSIVVQAPGLKEVSQDAHHAANVFSKLSSAVSSLASRFLHLTSSIGKRTLATAFSAALIPARALSHAIGNIHSKLATTIAALKRIAVYRLIRTLLREFTQGLTEGIQNLYHFSEYVGTRFHSSMDSMATSALYIKNTFATIAEPILNVLAPAIEFLADRFAALAASIAEFLAALTGQDQYTIALRFPKEYGEEAEETAKAMQKWLGPFDEINRLSDPRKSGKEQGLDWTKMFETMTVEGTGPIGQFVQKLKEGFQQGDLTEIGTILSEKLQQAMDGLNWPDIKKKARKLASSIGTFIMGFFKGNGFTTKLGTTIAEALNTGVDFAATLKEKIDFDTLGTSLGEGLNAFLEKFDFEKFVGTIFEWGEGLVTFLSSAVSTVDWGGLGEKIGQALKHTPEWWAEKFGKVFELAENIITGLLDFVSGVTKDGTLESVFEGFGKAIGEAISDEKFWKKCFEAVGTIGTALVKGLFAAISGVYEGITGTDLNFTLSDDSAKTIFQTLFAGVTITKLLSWVFGGSSASVGAGLSIGPMTLTIASLAITAAAATLYAQEVTRPISEHLGSVDETTGQEYLPTTPEEYLVWEAEMTQRKIDKQEALAELRAKAIKQEEKQRKELQKQLDTLHLVDDALDSGYKIGKRGYTIAGQFHGRLKIIRGQAESVTGEFKKTTRPIEQMKLAMSQSAKGIGKSAKYIKDWADVDARHINDIGKKADALKKKFGGKNALGESKFSAASKSIKDSAKSAADAIGSIGKKATTATSTLSTKTTESKGKIRSFKEYALQQLDGFGNGAINGMRGTMDDFIFEGASGLNTMLQNYSFFTQETGRLMQSTSSTYSGSGLTFYRSGGGGGGTQHPFTTQQYMANGGFVDSGEAFIARESGPELVGRIGSRTAVANNDQIVAGIAAGVSEANGDVVNAIYSSINQVIGVIRENRGKNGSVNWDAVSRQISRVQKRQAASAYM